MDARRSAANSFALRCYEHEEVRHSRFTFALVVVVVFFSNYIAAKAQSVSDVNLLPVTLSD